MYLCPSIIIYRLSSSTGGVRGNSEPSGRGSSHSAKGNSLRNEVVAGTLEPVFREAKDGHRLGEGDQGRTPLAFPTASLLLFSTSNNKPPCVVGPEARLPHPVSRQDSNGYPTPSCSSQCYVCPGPSREGRGRVASLGTVMNSHRPAARLPRQDSDQERSSSQKAEGAWSAILGQSLASQSAADRGAAWALLRDAESGPFPGTADSGPTVRQAPRVIYAQESLGGPFPSLFSHSLVTHLHYDALTFAASSHLTRLWHRLARGLRRVASPFSGLCFCTARMKRIISPLKRCCETKCLKRLTLPSAQ